MDHYCRNDFWECFGTHPIVIHIYDEDGYFQSKEVAFCPFCGLKSILELPNDLLKR
jgi:hypothetical protein